MLINRRILDFAPLCDVLHKSISFDGVNDVIFRTGASGLARSPNEDFHIECWMYSTSASEFGGTGNRCAISTRILDGQGGASTSVITPFLFQTISGDRFLRFISASIVQWRLADVGITSPDTWYHIAITRTNSSVWKLYVNGIPYAPQNVSGAHLAIGSTDPGLCVGAMATLGGTFWQQYFTGRIAGLFSLPSSQPARYTPAAIAERANACAPYCKPIKISSSFFYLMNDTQASQTILDSSGSNLNLIPFSPANSPTFEQAGPCQ